MAFYPKIKLYLLVFSLCLISETTLANQLDDI